MIPLRQIETPDGSWTDHLKDAVSSPAELLALLGLEDDRGSAALAANRDFPLLVPRSFVARMRPGDPDDPLLRQVLPSAAEALAQPGYSRDPVGEVGKASAHPGVIRKYRGRALLILAGGCAVNCRYCFRRHFPYGDHQNSRGDWQQALESIAGDRTISEVILSGGDPLLVADTQLSQLAAQIAALPHVKRLRVHTRLPVVIPQRVTEGLLSALCQPGLQTVLVIHCNHARELGDEVHSAMALLRQRGITLLNQSVLLAGVNDSAAALVQLSESLFAAGVLPYYLHLLDRVQGAAHFDVPQERAQLMLGEASAALPGYLLPRLVRESAGEVAKTIIPPIYPTGMDTCEIGRCERI